MRRSRNESYSVVGKFKGNKFGSEGEFRGGKVKSVVNNVDENKGKEPTKAESSLVVWVGTGDCDDLTEKLARQKTEQTAAAILYRAKSARERKLAPSKKTPYTGAKIVKNLVTGKNSNNRYDPFEKPNNVKVVSLNIWLESNGNTARGKESNEWYHRLRTPSDWLRDVHLDAAMAMLRRRYYFNSRCFRSARLAFLDTIFQVLWIDKYRQFLQSQPEADGTGRLLPPGTFDYVNGLKPVEFNTVKVWLSEVDDIYCPLNVSNSHWVAMWISLPNRKITIFDSHVFMKLVSDEELEKVVTSFATLIPYAMRAVNPDANTSITPYTWERIKAGVPQNRKSGDCGVYVFKYLECHALGLYPFPKALRDSNIKQIREKLAVEIFDELAETGQRDCDAGDVDLYEREG